MDQESAEVPGSAEMPAPSDDRENHESAVMPEQADDLEGPLFDSPYTPLRGRRRVAGITPLGLIVLVVIGAIVSYYLAPVLSQEVLPGGASPAGPFETVAPEATEGQLPIDAEAGTPGVNGPAPLTPAEFDARLGEAADLVRQSALEEAIVIYEDLAGREPGDARPWTGWAWALLLDGQPDAALAQARHAVELQPLDSEASAMLARAYLANGLPDRAVAMALSAADLELSAAGAHATLTEAYRHSGRFDQAMQEAELALALDAGNADAHRAKGWLYYALGDPGQALGALQTAAELEPELWLRQYELGIIQIRTGDYEAALASLQAALALREETQVHTALADVYYQLGELDRARAALERALTEGEAGAGIYALLSLIDAKDGRCDDSNSYLEQAFALDPANPRALEARDLCQIPGLVAAAPTITPTQTAELPTAPGSPTPGSPTAVPPKAEAVKLAGRIAFAVWNEQQSTYDLYVAGAADGEGRHLVAERVHQPAFSPDGAWLAVNGERKAHENLSILRPDGSGLREITEHTEDGLPYWSPEGRSLVFSSTRHGDRQSRVYVLDSVPLDGGRAPGRSLNSGLDDVRGRHPTWTASGQIVYSGCDHAASPVVCGLLRISAEPGSHAPAAVTTYAGDTAPDAYRDRVVFMSNQDGNWEIYAVNLDGSDLQRLTDSPSADGLPTWSPDGKSIAFVSDLGGSWAVWAMDADGTNSRVLFDLGGGGIGPDWTQERISWGP